MEMWMPSARFERTTPGLGIRCSIHLSYEGALGRTRTCTVLAGGGQAIRPPFVPHCPPNGLHPALLSACAASLGYSRRGGGSESAFGGPVASPTS